MVDGSGSPPSTQIIFSAIDKQKEGNCALSPEEGEGLQDAVDGLPGEPPYQESGLVCLHTRRGLTPLLKLHGNPKIHVSPGEGTLRFQPQLQLRT